MREDAPVALEFAVPARLAVDGLACPLGRRARIEARVVRCFA